MLFFGLLVLTLVGCLAGFSRWAWVPAALALVRLWVDGPWIGGIVPLAELPFLVGIQDGRDLGLLQVLLVVYLAVHLYSVHYLGSERVQRRYFSLLALFLLGMATLMAAKSYLALVFGWEAIGLASFGLVSFYRQDDDVARQASWVFWLNRGGDASLLVGVCLAMAGHAGAIYGFVGAAVVKSALFPFSAWLRWAMVGPTPISALLHAATLVVSGVVLLTHPLVMQLWVFAPALPKLIGVWGVRSALLAAWAACQTTNLKRLLAYSTLAHIGLMMMVAPDGVLSLGHLGAHAIFKTGLFLSLGLLHRYDAGPWRPWAEVWQTLRRRPWALGVVGAVVCFAWALLGLAPLPAHASKAALFTTLGLYWPTAAPGLQMAYMGLTAVYAVRFVAGYAQALAAELETKPHLARAQVAIVLALVPLLAWQPFGWAIDNLLTTSASTLWMDLAAWGLLVAALAWQARERAMIALPVGEALFGRVDALWAGGLHTGGRLAQVLALLDTAWARLWVRVAQAQVVLAWCLTSAERVVLATIRSLAWLLLQPFRWLVDDAGTLSPARMVWTALAVALVAGWWFF